MISGIVDRVGEKSMANGRKLYSIKLQNNPTWFGTKFSHPGVSQGQQVEFEAAQNERGYWDVRPGTIKAKADAPAVTGPAVRQTFTNAKDDYWTRKEERDLVENERRHEGASRNTAIAFVDLLLKNNALAVPSKKAELADAILKYVETYKEQFMGVNKVNEAEKAEDTPVEAAEGGDWN